MGWTTFLPILLLLGCLFSIYRSTPVRRITWPQPLTFDLETGAQYRPWGKQPPYQFWCFSVISISTYRLTTVDASRDLSTLTFDLGGHSACRWCASSFSVCLQSLKFVGLSVRNIWRTSGLNIMSACWPWCLTFNFESGVRYCSSGGQSSYQFWCFWDVLFSTYRPKAQH